MKPLETTNAKDFFKAIRAKHKLTQHELADKLGVGQSTVALMETGKLDYPIQYARHLRKLCTDKEYAHLWLIMCAKIKIEMEL